MSLYLSTKTRPDIAYAVGNVARFTAKPMKQHWSAVKRMMRHLNSTTNHGLLYGEGSALFTMSGAAVSWMGEKQNCVTLSTTEAEYMALSMAAQESVWLERLLHEMNEKSEEPIMI